MYSLELPLICVEAECLQLYLSKMKHFRDKQNWSKMEDHFVEIEKGILSWTLKT